MEVINKIKIDLLKPGVKPMINAMQADENSRVLEITLNANGSAWEIPSGVTFSMAYKKPDGTRGMYDTMPDGSSASSVDGNVVSIRLAPQMLTTPGTVNASVVISNGDQRISTFPIIVNVIQSPAVGAVGSEDYFYSSVIGNLDDLKTTDKSSLVAAINEIFSTGGSGSNSGQNVELDTTLTQSGKAADAKAVGDKIAEITGISLVEPAHDDIPKVFFGGALQAEKIEAVVPFSYRSKTLNFDCYAEIKAQGNSTLRWPKKNQTVKLYADADCTEKLKVDFKGWGKQNKFVIKANWRDLTHVRDIVSVRLEGDCLRTNPDWDELPELLKTSPNLGGIDGFPVLVYAAGVYQGRYMWNIPKDKWMANMDDDLDEHCILCSENYVSGCFRAAASINGSDWTDEIHDTVPESIKTRWNEVISFVMNSTDEEFVANLDSYIKVSTLIDRHIMGLLSCDFDGYGKNQLYITYDGQQWYADRYDKDGTWGNYWNGNTMLPSDYGRDQYEDMTTGVNGNLLFIRLEQLFWNRLQTRWAELKTGALSIPNIINRFRELYDITPHHLIAEDYASTTAGGAFTGIPNKTTCTIQQIQTFVVERHAWTDEYIAGLTPEIPVPCEGITLDKTALTFTADGTQTVTATVVPDGCTDDVVWVSSNPEIATISVSGYVCTVEAIANGNTTITATCGEYNASCSVAVSGIAESIPCTGITLNTDILSFSSFGSQTLTATVTPTDTTDVIIWNSDDVSVATVSNGVVTAIAWGECTITATCGNYSASCSVNVSRADLPSEYSQLNYIESSGEQYIDTGVSGGTNAAYEIVFNNFGGDTRAWAAYFGGDKKPSSVPKLFWWLDSGITAQAGSDNHTEFVNEPDDAEAHSYAYGTDGVLTVDGTNTFAFNCAGAGWGTLTWYVFNTHGEPANISTMRLHSLKMWTDGNLVRDLIPAQRNADSTVGLYDTVTNTFFENAGSGVFAFG